FGGCGRRPLLRSASVAGLGAWAASGSAKDRSGRGNGWWFWGVTVRRVARLTGAGRLQAVQGGWAPLTPRSAKPPSAHGAAGRVGRGASRPARPGLGVGSGGAGGAFLPGGLVADHAAVDDVVEVALEDAARLLLGVA